MIEVHELTKKFGNHTVLENISVIIEEEKIVGIIGYNGSGKTVLMKCICGFLPIDYGYISINGQIIGKDIDIPKNVGIILETPSFLKKYSAFKNLQQLAKINNKIDKKDIYDAISTVGLDPKSTKKVGKYSLGMRQRLGLAQAIMENPDILILDEPFNGLDKEGVRDMREHLLNLKRQGKIILIASHSTEDIDILCDSVYEIDKGKLIKIR